MPLKRVSANAMFPAQIFFLGLMTFLQSFFHRSFGETWLDLELGREVRQWSPWKDGDELPEDKERFVEFEFVCGFLVDFSRLEIISNFCILGLQRNFLKICTR